MNIQPVVLIPDHFLLAYLQEALDAEIAPCAALNHHNEFVT